MQLSQFDHSSIANRRRKTQEGQFKNYCLHLNRSTAARQRESHHPAWSSKMAFKLVFPSQWHHHSSSHYSSSSGSDSSGSWPFGVIRSSTSHSSTSEMEILVCKTKKRRAAKVNSLKVHVPMPERLRWPTRETIIRWEKEQARIENMTIICIDTNVATLILDGEALKRAAWNLYSCLPTLATAVSLAPNQDPDKVVRIS